VSRVWLDSATGTRYTIQMSDDMELDLSPFDDPDSQSEQKQPSTRGSTSLATVQKQGDPPEVPDRVDGTKPLDETIQMQRETSSTGRPSQSFAFDDIPETLDDEGELNSELDQSKTLTQYSLNGPQPAERPIQVPETHQESPSILDDHTKTEQSRLHSSASVEQPYQATAASTQARSDAHPETSQVHHTAGGGAAPGVESPAPLLRASLSLPKLLPLTQQQQPLKVQRPQTARTNTVSKMVGHTNQPSNARRTEPSSRPSSERRASDSFTNEHATRAASQTRENNFRRPATASGGSDVWSRLAVPLRVRLPYQACLEQKLREEAETRAKIQALAKAPVSSDPVAAKFARLAKPLRPLRMSTSTSTTSSGESPVQTVASSGVTTDHNRRPTSRSPKPFRRGSPVPQAQLPFFVEEAPSVARRRVTGSPITAAPDLSAPPHIDDRRIEAILRHPDTARCAVLYRIPGNLTYEELRERSLPRRPEEPHDPNRDLTSAEKAIARRILREQEEERQRQATLTAANKAYEEYVHRREKLIEEAKAFNQAMEAGTGPGALRLLKPIQKPTPQEIRAWLDSVEFRPTFATSPQKRARAAERARARALAKLTGQIDHSAGGSESFRLWGTHSLVNTSVPTTPTTSSHGSRRESPNDSENIQFAGTEFQYENAHHGSVDVWTLLAQPNPSKVNHRTPRVYHCPPPPMDPEQFERLRKRLQQREAERRAAAEAAAKKQEAEAQQRSSSPSSTKPRWKL